MDWLIVIGIQLLFFGVVLTVSGLAVLFALLRGAKPNGAVLAGALACGLLMVPLVLSQFNGKNPSWTDMQATMEKNFPSLMSALKNPGGPDDKADPSQAWVEKFYIQTTPASVAVACVCFSFLSYYVVSAFFRRLSPRIPKPILFSQWVIPEPLVFGFITGALLKIAAKFLSLPEDNWEDILGSNLLVFFGSLYIMGGFSIIAYYLQKWNVPSAFRFVFYVILFILCGPLFCLGLLDVWMDFRKIKSPTLEKTA